MEGQTTQWPSERRVNGRNGRTDNTTQWPSERRVNGRTDNTMAISKRRVKRRKEDRHTSERWPMEGQTIQWPSERRVNGRKDRQHNGHQKMEGQTNTMAIRKKGKNGRTDNTKG